MNSIVETVKRSLTTGQNYREPVLEIFPKVTQRKLPMFFFKSVEKINLEQLENSLSNEVEESTVWKEKRL